jgi:hypothetical protein
LDAEVNFRIGRIFDWIFYVLRIVDDLIGRFGFVIEKGELKKRVLVMDFMLV